MAADWFAPERLLRTWRNDLPREQQLEHCALGLLAEVGELVGAVHKGKFKRGFHGLKKRIGPEVGDCLYYLQMAAHLTGGPLLQKPARVAPMQPPAPSAPASAFRTCRSRWTMGDRPTLYLSNWSSYRTPGMHGPGRKFTIMANPRRWEHGIGTLAALVPPVSAQRILPELLESRRTGAGTMLGEVYRELCQNHFDARMSHLYHGALTAYDADGFVIPAEDGDTLCCACSVAEARAGRCHRTWAAPFLVRAGWRVILDGVEVPNV